MYLPFAAGKGHALHRVQIVRRGLAVVALASLLCGSAACQDSEQVSNAELMRAVQELRVEVASLGAKVSRLEEELRQARTAPPTASVAAPAARPPGFAAAAAGSAEGQCTALTKKGSRCTRKAESGGKYCWQHKR
ncbi:MAG: hypothetical protein GC160_26115 [Acidobacteria bacterium]|nr:hypothetical protein [Acidobacteriota bacterium]